MTGISDDASHAIAGFAPIKVIERQTPRIAAELAMTAVAQYWVAIQLSAHKRHWPVT